MPKEKKKDKDCRWDFESKTDLFISEILCDECKNAAPHGKCDAEPPCETYDYLESKT